MKKITITVENITCQMCANSINKYFEKLGIKTKVLVNLKKVIFNYDDSKYSVLFLINSLRKIGYKPINDQKINKNKLEIINLIISSLLFITSIIINFIHINNTPTWVVFLFLSISTIFITYFSKDYYIRAFFQIKTFSLGMDVLILSSSIIAYIYSISNIILGNYGDSFFMVVIMIIYLTSVGNFIENKAKSKSNNLLNELLEQSNIYAKIIKNNTIEEVSVYDILKDDIVIVDKGEKILFDGHIVDGGTHVDQSDLTGETYPVFKNVDDKVLSSTTNLSNTIKMCVDKTYTESTYSKVVEEVLETSLIKPRLQKIADSIAKYFVVAILLISITTFLVLYFTNIKTLTESIKIAIAILAISCPCAFGLATPISIQIASALSFKKSILYKDGKFFEIGKKIEAICFDKTKTLTKGIIKIEKTYGDTSIYKYIASLEKISNHPIAQAFEIDKTLDVENFLIIQSYGIVGKIKDYEVGVYSKNYLEKNSIKDPFEKEYIKETTKGKIAVYGCINGVVKSLYILSDDLKEDTVETLFYIKLLGYKTYLLTGDNKYNSEYIKDLLNIDYQYNSLLPKDKGDIIKEISKKYKTAYIGDGVNDILALKNSDISYACYNAVDIAKSIGNVKLLNNDLLSILYSFELSKKVVKNIYQNFTWAFLYNLVMIPLAMMGYISALYSALGMILSSLFVVANATRLMFFKFKKENLQTKFVVDDNSFINQLKENNIKYRKCIFKKNTYKTNISKLFEIKNKLNIDSIKIIKI